MPEVGVDQEAKIVRNENGYSKTQKARRFGSRKGNALIEFALIAMPMFALFFGIADVAFAVFLKNMLQSAVRDGVRFGVTYGMTFNGTNCATQTACVTSVTQANAMGFLAGAKSSLIKVKYFSPDNLNTPLTPGDVGPGKKLADGTDLLYMNQPGNLIEVAVENFPWSWMVPLPKQLVGNSITMSQYASDVLQGLPVGAVAPPAP
ncbi:MAG: hypothetical protein OHK0021_13800 [Bryobacter sp.]